jgi:uncharacterized membrane-anchored protein
MPANLLLAFVLTASTAFLVDQSASAQEPDLPLVPQPIRWLKGPAEPALGSAAGLNLPEGFRFVDGQPGKTMLESLKIAVPEGFVGVVSPSSGEWALTLAYTQDGHVPDSEWQKLDSDHLLKAIWDRTAEQNPDRVRQGLPAVAHVNWAMKPEYDGKSHLLQWAVAQDGNLEKDHNVAYTARLFGRRGVIEAKVTRRDSSDLTSVKELVKKIQFKQGELYTDYQKKDQMAVVGMTGIPASQTKTAQKASVEEHASNAQGAGAMVLWFGLGAIAFVGLVGATFLAKKIRSEKAGKAVSNEVVTEKAVRPTNGSAHRRETKLNLKSGMVRPLVNGNGNGYANGHAKVNGNGNPKKRRMFNYEKFYTEMMLQGPAPVIGEPYAGFNGYNNGANEANGTNGANGNGHNGHDSENGYQNGYGNGNGHSVSKPEPRDANQMLAAHAELIASQKSFIEEQKRLIQEQARLIEEKSRLISEKNTLLDRQSQMIDSNLL